MYVHKTFIRQAWRKKQPCYETYGIMVNITMVCIYKILSSIILINSDISNYLGNIPYCNKTNDIHSHSQNTTLE